MSRINYKNCPLCESTNIQTNFEVKDHSHSQEVFLLAQCGDCGFLMTNDVPAESEIGPYYKSDDYISHSDTQKGITFKLYHWARKLMLRKKSNLIKRLSNGKSLLDVGAGTGYFPNQMKENGYDVVGVEVDDDTRNYAINKFGFKIYSSVDEVKDKEEQEFDFITLWHVMEHLYGPKAYMAKFASLLKADGHLIIAVPNADSHDGEHYKDKWAAYDVPIHLWHFTPETMENLAAKTGFKVVEMHQLPFDSFYISMLSEKYKGSGSFMGLIKGGWHGFLSYLKGKKNVRRSSSVIYVLKKV